MKQRELVDRLMADMIISKTEAEKLLKSFIHSLSKMLAEGNEVRLEGLGKFNTDVRHAKVVNNNFAGQKCVLKPAIMVRFTQYDSSRLSLVDLCPIRDQLMEECQDVSQGSATNRRPAIEWPTRSEESGDYDCSDNTGTSESDSSGFAEQTITGAERSEIANGG
jgi:nucleoid DNA-binding protein